MTSEDSPSFTTKRRTIGSNDEHKWGGDGENWQDAIDTKDGVTVTDNGTITSTLVLFSEGFESGDLSNWTITGESDGVETVTSNSRAIHSGSYGLELRSNPGGSSSAEVTSVDSFDASNGFTYTTYLNKFRDDGDENGWNIKLYLESNSDVSIGVSGTSYNGNGVRFQETDSNGRVTNHTIRSEFATDAWQKITIKITSNNEITVTLNDTESYTETAPASDFNQNLQLRLRANAWSSGDAIYIATDDITID